MHNRVIPIAQLTVFEVTSPDHRGPEHQTLGSAGRMLGPTAGLRQRRVPWKNLTGPATPTRPKPYAAAVVGRLT